MIPSSFRRIGETPVYVSGIDLDMATEEAIALLKRCGIRKVFCLYSLNQKFISRMPEAVRNSINWGFIQKLSENGIKISSMLRSPDHMREYDSFVREAGAARGPFLIQCYGGRHASGAYAFYYLAKTTPLTRDQLRGVFFNSGFSGNDMGQIEGFFRSASTSLEQIFEAKKAVAEKKAPKRIQKKEPKIRWQPRRR